MRLWRKHPSQRPEESNPCGHRGCWVRLEFGDGETVEGKMYGCGIIDPPNGPRTVSLNDYQDVFRLVNLRSFTCLTPDPDAPAHAHTPDLGRNRISR